MTDTSKKQFPRPWRRAGASAALLTYEVSVCVNNVLLLRNDERRAGELLRADDVRQWNRIDKTLKSSQGKEEVQREKQRPTDLIRISNESKKRTNYHLILDVWTKMALLSGLKHNHYFMCWTREKLWVKKKASFCPEVICVVGGFYFSVQQR